jgi:hypothetical protein
VPVSESIPRAIQEVLRVSEAPNQFRSKTDSWTLVAMAAALVAGHAWADLRVPAWTLWALAPLVVADVFLIGFWANLTLFRVYRDWGNAPTVDEVVMSTLSHLSGGEEK